jgi:signal transduction histidine kinase
MLEQQPNPDRLMPLGMHLVPSGQDAQDAQDAPDVTERTTDESAVDAAETAPEPALVEAPPRTVTGRARLVLARVYVWLEANTFIPPWLPSRWHRKRFGYSVAALAQVVMTLVTWLLLHLYPTFSFVGILNFLVVALIALSWGAVPALVATVVGAVSLEALLVLPPFTWPTHPAGELVEISLFLVAGLIAAVGASRTEGARRHAVRKHAQAQAARMGLEEANRRMDGFLALVTHELKNPLSAMQLATQLARRYITGVSEAERHLSGESADKLTRVMALLNQIERQAALQNRLIGDLLDVSRIQSDRLELSRAPCDLLPIVTQAVEDQRLAWPEREITLVVESCGRDGHIAVVADAERIGQVVSNYLTNALKYSAADKPVRVGVRCDGRTARLAVRDEGPGLPPKEQAKIWQRFYRAEGIEVQSGSGVGLGMGLHICKNLIDRHGGRVGVESAPGKGSTFFFTLPIARGKRD